MQHLCHNHCCGSPRDDAAHEHPLALSGGTAVMNPTIELMNARCSTRVYSDEPITAEEKQAILHTAMRAPTAGNMMLYSIIQVEEQTLKDRLAVTCDDQPFIAKAPWVLLFVADSQKWTDLFAHSKVREVQGCEHRETLGAGDLLLACSDALIAAQNAVIAAESLGIGSCYIGDILSNGEEHARLFDLPEHTLPIALLCFGRPKAHRAPVGRQEEHVVMRDRYHRLSDAELHDVAEAMERTSAPNGLPPGFANYPQLVYARKFVSADIREMNRSGGWWIDRWSGEAK
jgi:nitroreductase